MGKRMDGSERLQRGEDQGLAKAFLNVSGTSRMSPSSRPARLDGLRRLGGRGVHPVKGPHPRRQRMADARSGEVGRRFCVAFQVGGRPPHAQRPCGRSRRTPAPVARWDAHVRGSQRHRRQARSTAARRQSAFLEGQALRADAARTERALAAGGAGTVTGGSRQGPPWRGRIRFRGGRCLSQREDLRDSGMARVGGWVAAVVRIMAIK
jgi:hypothetical protein